MRRAILILLAASLGGLSGCGGQVVDGTEEEDSSDDELTTDTTVAACIVDGHNLSGVPITYNQCYRQAYYWWNNLCAEHAMQALNKVFPTLTIQIPWSFAGEPATLISAKCTMDTIESWSPNLLNQFRPTLPRCLDETVLDFISQDSPSACFRKPVGIHYPYVSTSPALVPTSTSGSCVVDGTQWGTLTNTACIGKLKMKLSQSCAAYQYKFPNAVFPRRWIVANMSFAGTAAVAYRSSCEPTAPQRWLEYDTLYDFPTLAACNKYNAKCYHYSNVSAPVAQ